MKKCAFEKTKLEKHTMDLPTIQFDGQPWYLYLFVFAFILFFLKKKNQDISR